MRTIWEDVQRAECITMIATNCWQGFLAVSYFDPIATISNRPRSLSQSPLPVNGEVMCHHVKKLMHTVNSGEPGPRFGRMLLEQFGVSTPRSKGEKSQA
jgi:hypothetical protein